MDHYSTRSTIDLWFFDQGWIPFDQGRTICRVKAPTPRPGRETPNWLVSCSASRRWTLLLTGYSDCVYSMSFWSGLISSRVYSCITLWSSTKSKLITPRSGSSFNSKKDLRTRSTFRVLFLKPKMTHSPFFLLGWAPLLCICDIPSWTVISNLYFFKFHVCHLFQITNSRDIFASKQLKLRKHFTCQINDLLITFSSFSANWIQDLNFFKITHAATSLLFN